MPPVIKLFEAKEWATSSSELIQSSVVKVLAQQGHCAVMLTGGRSAERLYTAWSVSPGFSQMQGVQFYFGDERCVPPYHQNSNYGLAMRTLFRRGIPVGASVHRMEADLLDRDLAARSYEGALPEQLDVMLLGVGEDGHIASLFPGSPQMHETARRVLPVTGPKLPCERLTIAPAVIAGAQLIFVLAQGFAKAAVLSSIISAEGDPSTTPARLVLDATWLLDTVI